VLMMRRVERLWLRLSLKWEMRSIGGLMRIRGRIKMRKRICCWKVGIEIEARAGSC
jgi:hypothetical protein